MYSSSNKKETSMTQYPILQRGGLKQHQRRQFLGKAWRAIGCKFSRRLLSGIAVILIMESAKSQGLEQQFKADDVIWTAHQTKQLITLPVSIPDSIPIPRRPPEMYEQRAAEDQLEYAKADSKKRIEASEIDCLAENMYYEARNQPLVGVEAVGHVTMNRLHTHKFGSSVCAVVFAKAVDADGKEHCQFSWVCAADDYKKVREPLNLMGTKYMAEQIYYGHLPDNTGGALYYHAVDIHPSFFDRLSELGQIKDHVFFGSQKKVASK